LYRNLRGLDGEHVLDGVVFENLVIVGKKRTSLADAEITTNSFVRSVTFILVQILHYYGLSNRGIWIKRSSVLRSALSFFSSEIEKSPRLATVILLPGIEICEFLCVWRGLVW